MNLPNKIQKWTHVEIEWEDVRTTYGPLNSVDFVLEFKPCIRRMSGYVVFYSKRAGYLFLASQNDQEAGTEGDCEDITTIPLNYIRELNKK